MRRIEMFFLIFILFCSNAFAFNWNKCKRYLNKDNSMTGAAAFASTTSFFSSTGECAMIGETEHDKKVYFVHNFDKMEEDFAKGSGEYAQSFASMHGCSTRMQIAYPQIMKGYFKESRRFDSEPTQETYEYLESIFIDHPILKKECKLTRV